MDIMTFFKKNKKQGSTGGGFTILYAILITTVVLTIGLSLLDVLVQEVSLSGTERESALSFYATDSGMECALYWDVRGGNAFSNGAPINCNDVSLSPIISTTSPDPIEPAKYTYVTYPFSASFPNGCANVKVIKKVDIISGAVVETTIQSRGYNTTCPPAVSEKPWRLERGLQIVY